MKADVEDKDVEKEKIRFIHVKTMYEKYCYVNQLRERKLDDEENTKILESYGFVIEVKQDALTQVYSHVKLINYP